MFKSFLRAMSVSMLVVGTVIGAGFASGREVVAFFGAEPSLLAALIAGVLVFGCSVLFLFVGRRVKKDDIGEVNGAVFGKIRPIADIFVLFNSITVLGAMLAGTDSLAAEFLDVRPLASIVLGVICAVVAVTGLKGVIKANAVLVPVMIAFIAISCLLAIDYPFSPSSSPIKPYSIILYVSMNMILGGGVLTTVHHLSPREIILSSAVAAVIIAVLLTVIMGALRSTSAALSDMPMLLIALKSGKPMYFIALPVIALSIFTTMLSAFKALYDYIIGFIKYKWIAAGLVLIAGLAVGLFGFSVVVGKIYPITGAIGLVYLAFNLAYLIKTRVKRKVRRGVKKVKKRLNLRRTRRTA
ncbi:MAG: hypothetical protein J1F33_02610 [Clostridiales bacterium]|nr:hypothetical protein [Clostridiales bacterium]